MARPLPPNKATITANQDAELANIAPPTTVPAMPSASQKTPAAILQTLRSMAPTLAMSIAIRMHAMTLRAANNALTTKDAVLGNQGKPLVLQVTKRAQTIGSLLSQRPITMTTSATHGPTAKQKRVAELQTPPVLMTNDNPPGIALRLASGYLSGKSRGGLI